MSQESFQGQHFGGVPPVARFATGSNFNDLMYIFMCFRLYFLLQPPRLGGQIQNLPAVTQGDSCSRGSECARTLHAATVLFAVFTINMRLARVHGAVRVCERVRRA